MVQNNYFQIKRHEIDILEKNGCRAVDWSKVQVAAGFNPEQVRNIVFEGEIFLGALDGDIKLSDGSSTKVEISNARLKNVSIGDNCFISNIGVELSNLIVEAGVLIENVGKISCTGETTFGNGHEISVLNEAGGRELKISKETSAQLAYLSVFYRGNLKLIDKLDKISNAYSENVKSQKAVIQQFAKISNCTNLINVFIGEAAILDCVLSLNEGTVDSSLEAPTYIGSGVVAHNFICQKGAKVTDGAILASTLIGEACQVGKQFSSENSVLFANSEGFHSEIVSIFGGPHTVTHHKSTLLIAGMFSFYNAGSGTNQSNHMYKLGPVHQGILERGCKTGSSSYLLWPARIGAFTAVIGKHYANFDSSDLPFSYISEKEGKSMIIPGMNFFTTGTFRDGLKWPARDRRKNEKKLDLLIFDVLSPFAVQKVIRGLNILTDLYQNADSSQEFVTYKNIHIKRLLLKTCKRYYQLIIDKFFGDVLIRRIEKIKPEKLKLALNYEKESELATGEWIDVCGLLCSKKRLDLLIDKIENGRVHSYQEVHNEFEKIYNQYEIDAWNWFLFNYKKINGNELSDEPETRLIQFLSDWKDSSQKLLNMILTDSQKEFEGNVRIGYGIDGEADADFLNVRGSFEQNSFVLKIKQEIELVNSKFEQLKKLF